MRTFVSRNIFRVLLGIIICTSRILRQQKRSFGQTYSTTYEPKHSPVLLINTWWNYSTTCMICDHRHTNQLLAHVVTHGSKFLASTNHRQSFWVRYVSSTRLPYTALPTVGAINAGLPRATLLFVSSFACTITCQFPPPAIPPTAQDSMRITRETTVTALKYEGRTESHEQLFFACELGTADEGEYRGRWNQLLCYPWVSCDVNSLHHVTCITPNKMADNDVVSPACCHRISC